MAEKQRHLRNRYLIFTRTDERAFSKALVDAFHEFFFYDHRGCDDHALPLRRLVNECRNTYITGFFPKAKWQPIAERNDRYGFDRLVNFPKKFHFDLHRSEWNWLGIPRMAFDDPTLEEGSITSWFDRNDPDEKAFVRKIWRILDNMTTNRFKVEYPHLGEVLGETTSETWAGHDALRWCSQGKSRMLCGRWRPTDDWTFSDLPYYDGLDVGNPPDVCWKGNFGKTL